MADTVIGALSVKITADADGVEKGVKAAGDALQIGAKKLRSSANEFAKWGAAGVVAAGGITAAIVKTNLTAIRELKNTAQAANVTVEAFQRGAFAAEQFGISQEKYGDILKDVNDRVGDFITTGAGPMVDFFEQIGPKVGITADAFKGLSGQQAMGLYVQSLQKANVSQEEMTFFMEAMASDSTRLIPLFKDNAKQLNAMSEEARALGIGLSEIDVAKAEAASSELAKASGLFDAMNKQLTVELAPVIAGITNQFVEMARNAGGASTFIQDSLNGVVSVIGVFADGIHGIQILFQGLKVIGLGVVGAITSALEGLTTGFAIAIDGVLGVANTAIAAINDISGTEIELIPSVQDTEFMKGLHADGNAFREIVAQAGEELHAMAMEELPSEGIKNFVATAQEEFTKLAEAKAAITGETEKQEGGSPEDSLEVVRERDKTKALIEELRARFEQENEILFTNDLANDERLIGKYEREQNMLQDALDNQLITQQAFNDASIQLDKDKERAKLNILTGALDAAAMAVSIGGKKTYKAQKAIAVASAVVKGKQAAVDAWQAGMSTGGPWAPVVAAAYTAASIANTASMINSIKSGGSSMSGAKAGGGIPTASTGGSTQAQTQQQTQSPRNISINMQGNAMFSTDQVRELIVQINEATGDGVELNFTGA